MIISLHVSRIPDHVRQVWNVHERGGYAPHIPQIRNYLPFNKIKQILSTNNSYLSLSSIISGRSLSNSFSVDKTLSVVSSSCEAFLRGSS